MNKPVFVISCPIDCYSGYSARSRDIVKSIIEMDKYDVKILPQRWGSTPEGFIHQHSEEWGFLRDYILTDPQLKEKPDIWMQITIPGEFQPVGKYNIGCTAGIESTIAPAEWVEGCNRMDLILGSSQHTLKVLKESVFEKRDKNTNQPIGRIEFNTNSEVIFEGARTNVYKPLKKLEGNVNLDGIKENFAYLFVGHWMNGDIGEDRKNVGLLVKSFSEIFKNKTNPPALILKTTTIGSSYMDRDEIVRRVKAIQNTVKGHKLPNIYILHGEFSDEEMNEIYNHPKIKTMVSLTKGEGFGRPLLEFSLTNKPIITTNWSGHIDYLNPEFTTLIHGELTNIHPTAANDMLLKEAKWFSVDTATMGGYLKHIYENYKKYKDLANRQGYYSRENFSYEKMKEKLETVLSDNIPEFPKQVDLKLPKLELPKLQKVEK